MTEKLSRYTAGTGKYVAVEISRSLLDLCVAWIKARHEEQRGEPPLPESEQIQHYDRINHVGGLSPKSETCPNCGASLEDRGCKLCCPNKQCGYFVSCSEF